ncbi:hypothetical protein Sjap_023021 [Stephania japonica]|uniref:Oxysterol-binding protein n=1 Tax=Stephania japonica TaxID=461633 RepID=A0AAP0EYS1_9MAGN
MSAYDNVVLGKLKLKGKALDVKERGVKKKKDYDSNAGVVEVTELSTGKETSLAVDDANESNKLNEENSATHDDHLTPVERRYIEQKEKIDAYMLAKTANKSHRDRIQDFNQYLANLSEHYDIPKVVEGMMSTKAVLTPPVMLESSASDQAEYKAPNIIQRIFSLFKNIRPGTDLTHFELPPLFNLPKSQLQCYGESVYCTSVGEDLLSKCNEGGTQIERLLDVVTWSISTLRPLKFGVAPYNPILGETHHVSRGSLNVIIEQLCHNVVGASIEAIVNGKRRLKLLSHGETYVMNSPKLWIRVFPVPSTGWGGNVRIECKESGLEAQLCYKGTSFLGIGGNPRSLKGKILESSTLKPLYEIDGCWDSTVVAKEVKTGKTIVIYDAKEALSRMKTPEVRDPNGLSASESAVIWGEVSQSILNKEWEKAGKAKKAIEEKQRKDAKDRKSRGEVWVPKHFNLTHTKEEGWDCHPKVKWVPPAPIVASL